MTSDDITHFGVFIVALTVAVLGGAALWQAMAWRGATRRVREDPAEAIELDVIANR